MAYQLLSMEEGNGFSIDLVMVQAPGASDPGPNFGSGPGVAGSLRQRRPQIYTGD